MRIYVGTCAVKVSSEIVAKTLETIKNIGGPERPENERRVVLKSIEEEPIWLDISVRVQWTKWQEWNVLV